MYAESDVQIQVASSKITSQPELSSSSQRGPLDKVINHGHFSFSLQYYQNEEVNLFL
jgi:hypothetical protein